MNRMGKPMVVFSILTLGVLGDVVLAQSAPVPLEGTSGASVSEGAATPLPGFKQESEAKQPVTPMAPRVEGAGRQPQAASANT